MNAHALFLTLAFAASFAPLLRPPAPTQDGASFPGWPTTYEGKSLQPVAPASQDAWFSRGFPGRISRFSDGSRQIVTRFVSSPTRRLHPASQCFAAAGYTIAPAPMQRSSTGVMSSCFTARKQGQALLLCEHIEGSDGRTYADVSSWYWSALFGPAGVHWWSYVVAENTPTR